MGVKMPSARPAGPADQTEREITALCDPVALEARLTAARARRAEVLARRKAGAEPPAPRRTPLRGFAEPAQPALATPAGPAPDDDPPPRAVRASAVASARDLAHRGAAALRRGTTLRPLPIALAGLGALVLAALTLLPADRTPAPPTAEATVAALPFAAAPAAVVTAPVLVRPQTIVADDTPDPAPVATVTPPEAAPEATPPAQAEAATPSTPDPVVPAPRPRATTAPEPPQAAPSEAVETAEPAAPAPPRAERVLVYTSAGQAGEPLAAALGQAGFADVTTQPSRYPISTSNVRYYHATDAEAAAAIAAALESHLPDGRVQVRDFTTAERRTAAGRIEVWTAGNPAAAARAAPVRARASEADEIQRLVDSVLSQPAVSNTLRAVDRGLRDLDRGMQRTATEIERSLRNATR